MTPKISYFSFEFSEVIRSTLSGRSLVGDLRLEGDETVGCCCYATTDGSTLGSSPSGWSKGSDEFGLSARGLAG